MSLRFQGVGGGGTRAGGEVTQKWLSWECVLGGMCLGACIYIGTIGRFFVTSCLKVLLFLTFPLRKGLNFLRKQGKLLSKKLPKRETHGRKDAHAAKEREEENGT